MSRRGTSTALARPRERVLTGLAGVSVAVLLAAASVASAQGQVPARFRPVADTIVVNARIHSMDDRGTSAGAGTVGTAMAVRDGRVLGIGNEREIRTLAGPATEVLDLAGRTVIPGLIDTHSHLDSYGVTRWAGEVLGNTEFEWQVSSPPFDFSWDRNWDEGWEYVVKAASETLRDAVLETPTSEWIVLIIHGANCRAGFGQARYTKQNMQLDEIAPDHRVHVVCGPRPVLNSKAEAFYRSEWGDPMEPGLIDVFEDGTGRASNTLNRVLRTDYLTNPDQLAEILERQNRLWAATGITTWASTIRGRRTIDAFRLLDRRGRIGTRVAFSPSLGTLAQVTFERLHPDFKGYGTDYVWFNGMSLRGVDGAYPSFATTIEPPAIAQEIKDREWEKPTNSWVRDILATGHRYISTHMAGDFVVDTALDWIEEESAARGMSIEDIRAQRHGFDHCAMNPRPDQIPRLARLNVIMSCAPKYIDRTVVGIAHDYGERYTKWVVPVKSMIDGGVRTVFEIDSNGHPEFGSFYWLDLLVNRISEDGRVYDPEERIDRVLALKMATVWASEYVLREDVLGSLEPGKWADFVVLDKPYFDRDALPDRMIRTVRPLMTRVGNETVYLDPALAAELGVTPVAGEGVESQLGTLRQRIALWEADLGRAENSP